ncbi:MAG: hypothetical protein AYK22_01030 [Thermoplasmatales archaeon SG8-52-3]|nr:MAG: hypothetical protein AYK22_01030 [Thermoplasmatales archaeon SG8-52-3]
MKDINVKKILVFSIVMLLVGAVFIPYTSGEKYFRNNEIVIINVSQYDDTTDINYEINGFSKSPIIINDIEYSKILIGEESNLLLTGKPDIPNICRSILIPDTAKMRIEVIDSSYIEYNDVLIAPSKGDLPRSVDPDEIPYEFDEVYNVDEWYPGDIAKLREPYILRDYRSQVVEIYPIQYNPVKKLMRFYTDIEVKVFKNGIDNINIISRDNLPDSIDADFKLIYKNHFINFGKSERYDPVSEQGNMLIITYDSFWNSMIPYFQWKNMKGIPTEMVNVSSIGDANAIKNYIANYYNDYGLTYVLLVGDAAQVPTLYISQYSSSATDPSYSYIVGNDNYQDLFIGRFSAQNIEQLETQIERSLEYEKYPQQDAEWYQKGIGIASNQGPGDDGEYDDEHIDNIREDLLAYTYTEVDQIYDPQGTSSMVTDALNEGRSTINYCGHGSPTSWGSTGFNNNDINNLENDNMLPFISSVACNNGEFDNYDACFAEAWLRATNNGEPTGAIGVFASTQSQSWDPPMDAQDEIIDILVESYNDNIRTSFGALCFEGTMHMMDEYGSGCYDETDTWTVFGDPSLQVRTDSPEDLTVEHDELMPIGAEFFEVEIPGVKNALCAISHGYELLGYGYSDENGHAEVVFFEVIEFMEDVKLVVTAYNKNPYYADLQIGSSYPPEIPTIDGPISGRINKTYQFTAQTTDPEGDQIFYKFDWGDGTYTDWIGPVTSGTSVSGSHAWSEIGEYEVKVRAKDIEGAGSKWSDAYTVIMDIPDLNLRMKGGLFNIKTTIINEGIAEADNLNWEISLEGGIILLGRSTTGTITNISAGGEVSIISNLILGLGEVNIRIIISGPDCYVNKDRGGKVLLAYVHVNPGGE